MLDRIDVTLVLGVLFFLLLRSASWHADRRDVHDAADYVPDDARPDRLVRAGGTFWRGVLVAIILYGFRSAVGSQRLFGRICCRIDTRLPRRKSETR